MGRFNLLDESWISVLVERTGEKKDVSMVEFFRNASDYYSLAGEMETQNFAVMRFLLSVIHTVFSRFDYQGNVLPGVDLDERWIQTEDVDEDDLEDYASAVSECWKQLYLSGTFPSTLFDYLERWRDHFYLFDEEYPFYQVSKKEKDEILVKKSNGTTPIYGRNINRTISESDNKIALFSPIENTEIVMKRKKKRPDGTKDVLTEAELVRWLVMFHGYTGMSDKKTLVTDNQKTSKGWLFELGGIFLRGNNIFETLVMNYMPESPNDNDDFIGRIQKPCWEVSGSEVVKRICTESAIDNLAELYTNWSRAIYINTDTDMSKPLEIEVIKLPSIERTERSIEPMTLWQWNDKEKCFYPRRYKVEKQLWRNFGMLTGTHDNGDIKHHQPGIFKQLNRVKDAGGNRLTDLVGISMEPDANKSSSVPVDEITDSFRINDFVVTDKDSEGWVIRIKNTVETTKEVISNFFRMYITGICEIRRLDLKDEKTKRFVGDEIEKMYSTIDADFKEWITSIKLNDSKEAKISEWYSKLRKMVIKRGDELFENSTVRDLTGIINKNKKKTENIVTKYWTFVNMVDYKIGKGGKND